MTQVYNVGASEPLRSHWGRIRRIVATAKVFVRLVLLLPLASAIQAQTGTGLISGVVTDPSKAVVSAAKVVALENHTHSARNTTTNRDGFYSLSQLQPGDYDVSVEAAGFATYITHVEINVGARITVDVVLSLAALQTNTTVLASGGVQVETQTQMLSEVVNSQQITQLPTLTRNPYDLVLLAGNISPGDARGVGVAINGQRSASTDIMLDGAENTDVFMSDVGIPVPLDSVREFRLSQSTFTAEYGRASGGMVDVETRSGTNEVHGSVYEFNRVSTLAANTFDNNARGFPRGAFTRNQFGYALGGPILKNRLFFFQSTEWTRVRSEQTVLTLLPTPQYIAASAPATQDYFAKLGGSSSPINGPIITKADILAAGIEPNTGGPFDQLPSDTPIFGQSAYIAAVAAGGGNPQNTYNLVGRLDFNASENTKIFARLALYKEFDLPGASFATPYTGYESPFTFLHKNVLAGLTHVFSPTLVSLTKVGFSRLDHQFPLGANPLGPALYFPGGFALSGIEVTLPGYAFPPTGGTQYEGQISQDLTWSHGKHLLRAGGQFLRFRNVRAGFAGGVASQLLGSHASDSLDNFLAGQLLAFQVAIAPQGKFPCFNGPDGNPIGLAR
jgi:hypothetical protein